MIQVIGNLLCTWNYTQYFTYFISFILQASSVLLVLLFYKGY